MICELSKLIFFFFRPRSFLFDYNLKRILIHVSPWGSLRGSIHAPPRPLHRPSPLYSLLTLYLPLTRSLAHSLSFWRYWFAVFSLSLFHFSSYSLLLYHSISLSLLHSYRPMPSSLNLSLSLLPFVFIFNINLITLKK